VLAEEAGRWFRIEKSTPTSDFMLLAYPAREELRARIPAVVHVDGTSRVQTVRAEVNPRYHRLISAFHELTGVPMVLNTSFNDNEPIVCSPEHAIETFRSTRIDALAIGDFLVEATRAAPRD
jgi:carbamoyltransferase